MINKLEINTSLNYSEPVNLYIVSEIYYSSYTGRALYKVKNESDGLFYALKVFSDTGKELDSINREMIALNRQNQHPHLLPRYRGFHSDGKASYLLMDWMDGVTFCDATLGKPVTSMIDLKNRLTMVACLCDTVSHLHHCKYWHRDLKPQNVMLRDKRDPRKGIIVIDLGSAALNRGQTEGTKGYQAPEQSGQRAFNLGPWTDVFGIGQIAWYLLTGLNLALIENDDFSGWIDPTGKLQEALPSLSLPAQLEGILLKAMAFEPQKRFSKVLDFKMMIEKICR